MQNWKDIYKELADLVKSKIPAIKWQDLWHNQINFLDDEHPFPTPAVFYNFRILNTTDTGLKVQQATLQVDVYLYYETFADTYKDSWNQDSAMAFLDLLSQIFATLHASDGINYSSMRRIGFSAVDTGNAGNLYLQSFTCLLVDYAAQIQWEEQDVDDLAIDKSNEAPSLPDFSNGYDL